MTLCGFYDDFMLTQSSNLQILIILTKKRVKNMRGSKVFKNIKSALLKYYINNENLAKNLIDFFRRYACFAFKNRPKFDLKQAAYFNGA